MIRQAEIRFEKADPMKVEIKCWREAAKVRKQGRVDR